MKKLNHLPFPCLFLKEVAFCADSASLIKQPISEKPAHLAALRAPADITDIFSKYANTVSHFRRCMHIFPKLLLFYDQQGINAEASYFAGFVMSHS